MQTFLSTSNSGTLVYCFNKLTDFLPLATLLYITPFSLLKYSETTSFTQFISSHFQQCCILKAILYKFVFPLPYKIISQYFHVFSKRV